MPIELRILSGARAGQTLTFEKSQIAIGRHPMSDLAFDITKDLDVSTKHGEIRGIDGSFTIYDLKSTNGTFVNGERVAPGGSRTLRSGDTVGFGPHGPTMSVQIGGQPAPPAPRTSVSGSPPASSAAPVATRAAAPATGPAAAKRSGGTGERIAIAVKQQTRVLRNLVIAAVVVLGGIAVGAVFMERRAVARRDVEIAQLLKNTEEMSKTVQTKLGGLDDTSLTNGWKRRADSLSAIVRSSRSESAKAAAMESLRHEGELQKNVAGLDPKAVFAANAPAIVLINAEIGGQAQEATGFTVTAGGLIVTNQHVVADTATGARATRIHVKYTNSQRWLPAHIVKLASSRMIDLALIQLDAPGPYPHPTVALSATVDEQVGAAIMTIGFPGGTALPMEGSGNDAIAKPTLTMGTVSKSLSDVLQLDSFATHGASGEPVFDSHGHVVGAVSSGIHEVIVFAVPAEKISELVKSAK